MFDIEHLAKLAQKINAESVTLIPMRPQVRNKQIMNQMLTAQEFKRSLQEIVKVSKKYSVKFTTTIETDYKNIIHPDSIFRKFSSCAAGREGLNLDFDYKRNLFFVYGCSYCPASDVDANQKLRAPFIAGWIKPDNIKDFENIWNDTKCWKIYRDLNLKSDYCKECEYWLNHQCTGSCPIQNINYEELNLNSSIIEQLKEQLKNTAEWYCYKKILDE